MVYVRPFWDRLMVASEIGLCQQTNAVRGVEFLEFWLFPLRHRNQVVMTTREATETVTVE